MAPPRIQRVADPSLPFDPAGPLPELVALGGRLRQAREAQGLSRGDLAARLKIGSEQLEALEAGQRQRLREPVFVIALARRIAGCLELNVDPEIEALRSSPAFQPSRPAVAGPPRPSGQRPGAERSAAVAERRRRSAAFPGVVAAVVVAGIAAAALALQRGQPGIDLGRLPQLPSLPQLPFTAKPEPPQSRTAPPSPAATTAAGPAVVAAAPDTLVLSVEGRSWIEVTSTDGRRLFRGTLEGSRGFPLGQGLRVLAGRPDLVRAQLGDGPAQVLGRIDQVQWRRFPAASTAPAP